MKKSFFIPLGIVVALFMLGAGLTLAKNPFVAAGLTRMRDPQARDLSLPGEMPMGMRHADQAWMAVEKLAGWLNMEPEELVIDLQSGMTLSEIMAEQGFTKDQLRNNLRNEASLRIDEKVASGDLKEHQKPTLLEIYDQLFEKYSDRILNKDFSEMHSDDTMSMHSADMMGMHSGGMMH